MSRVPKEQKRLLGARDPERYRPVADAAEALVAELTRRYDVRVEDAPGTGQPGVRRAVRLVPARGATVVLVIHDDGYVDASRGHWDTFGFGASRRYSPVWDPEPEALVARLREWVYDVVNGAFGESLQGRRHRSWGARVASSSLGSAHTRLRAKHPDGRYDWPAWPPRGRSG